MIIELQQKNIMLAIKEYILGFETTDKIVIGKYLKIIADVIKIQNRRLNLRDYVNELENWRLVIENVRFKLPSQTD